MKDLIIFGNSDLAKTVTHFLQQDYNIAAYCVDKAFIKGNSFLSKPLVPFEDVKNLYPPDNFEMFIAIGYKKRNSVREQKINAAKNLGYNLISYIHPSATIDNTATIGKSCMILENCVVQAFSEMKNGCIMWANATLCHDSIVEENCFICSNACINGFVTVKRNTFIGAGAIIRDKITINKNNLIGAGCTIQSDTEEGAIYKNVSALKIN